MARYTGPKWRLARRENYDLFGNNKWRKRSTLPGQHPVSRNRPSNYSMQFREKQKLKRMFGMLEKQFRNTYKTATKQTGNTGLRLMQLLELRLDNVVYKLGLAKSIMQARQFVSHGHVLVNDKKIDIPSYTCKVDDEINLDPKLAKSDLIKMITAESKQMKKNAPKWFQGNKIVTLPLREMMDMGIREQLIIELYSR